MTFGLLPDNKNPGDPLTAAWVNLAAKNMNAMGLSRLPGAIIGPNGISQGPALLGLPPILAAEVTGNDGTDKWKHSWRALALDSSDDPVAYTSEKFPFEGRTTIQWAQTYDKKEEIPVGTPIFVVPLARENGDPAWLMIEQPRYFQPVVVKESSASGARGSDDVSTATITYDVWEQCGDTADNNARIGTDIGLPSCFRHTLTEYTPAPDDSVAIGYYDCAASPRDVSLLWVCELVTNRCCATTT